MEALNSILKRYMKRNLVLRRPDNAVEMDWNNESMLQLIERGADPNTECSHGGLIWTPLAIAMNGDEEFAQGLLEDDRTDPNRRISSDETILSHAIRYEETEIIRLLLDDPRTRIDDVSIFLQMGSEDVDPAFLRRYLSHSENDPNLRSDEHENGTLLHLAVLHTPELVEMLLRHPRINPNLKNRDGQTPIMNALNNDDTACFRMLLDDPRVDLAVRNEEGQTLLAQILAAETIDKERLRSLLRTPRFDPRYESPWAMNRAHRMQ